MIWKVIMVGGSIWISQMIARILWAMVFGGPGASKWLKNPAIRETRGWSYWSVLLVLIALFVFSISAVLLTTATLAGVEVRVEPKVTALGLMTLPAIGAYALAWCIRTALAEGAFPSHYGGSGVSREHHPVSFWLSTVVCAAALLTNAGLILLGLGFVFGFWG